MAGILNADPGESLRERRRRGWRIAARAAAVANVALAARVHDLESRIARKRAVMREIMSDAAADGRTLTGPEARSFDVRSGELHRLEFELAGLFERALPRTDGYT